MEVAAYRFKGGQKALSLSRGLEASHAPLSNPCRPVRILRSIVQTLVRPVFDPWNQVFLSGPIASEFVGDDDSGGETSRFQQFAKEFLRRSLVAVALHQDIKDLIVGIHGSPEVVLLAFDSDYDLIEMPLVSRLGATATNLIGIGLRKLFTPLADRFVGDLDASIEHHFLAIAKAEGKGVVEPDAVTNDLDGKSVVFVADAHSLALTDADKDYHES